MAIPFVPEQIARAVRLQALSYRLLRWVADAASAGRLVPRRAHDLTT